MLAQAVRDAKLDPEMGLREGKTDARTKPVCGACGGRTVIALARYYLKTSMD